MFDNNNEKCFFREKVNDKGIYLFISIDETGFTRGRCVLHFVSIEEMLSFFYFS